MPQRKTYQSDFKVKVVLESFQRDTTIEKIKTRYGVSTSIVNKWREIFRRNAYLAFETRHQNRKTEPGQSLADLKSIIGELTIENALLKKALSVWD